MATAHSRQTLLIDADDTLWENNIYFERAIADFISYLNHHRYTPEEVRIRLNEVEHANTQAHGYGVASFSRALITTFEQLSIEPITPDKHERIVGFARQIAEQQIELIDGVAETLPHLASRHQLILTTKGNPDEQALKLTESGLAQHFKHVEILREKNVDAYRELQARHQLNAQKTWMIGNSPRSDINPALAAGLHAIFIHHPSTWVLEHETISAAPHGQTLLQLENFAELAAHF
ncbi:HAD family hydrolase [Silvibacterium acidisoli]|uniref:HAD family hydrolase n=1 Tax=Acidobacteriaceae bacterium ZG23-2 TaxID=2883246 RepID=UPI00406C1976